jgi:peptidyl-prolyl cis-trans isomerase-like 3
MSITLHTSHGDIKCEIFCEDAPRSAKNFLALSAMGYYDNTLFHRNIKGFIIQGGDPTGTGRGGNSIYGKFFDDEINPILKHDRRGILSFANSGNNTNGSQFFISYSKQTDLDGKYSIFGKVIDGFETLDFLEREQVGKNNRPLNECKINSVTIHSNPIAESES